MKKLLLMSAVTLTIVSACKTGSKDTTDAVDQNALTTGINLANLDTTCAPGVDFYQYATGGWQKANPLTDEYSRFGSFDVLGENNLKRLRDLVEEIASAENEPGSLEARLALFYNTAMDSTKLNETGLETLKVFLGIDGYQATPEMTEGWIANFWSQMQRCGVPGLYGFYVGADAKDSKNNILEIYQGGMTLPERDYYLSNDAANVAIRKAYVEYINKMTARVGFTPEQVKTIASDVMRIETRMAKACRSNVELRDPEKNYNKMSYDELKNEFAGIDWDTYFENFGIKKLDNVIVGQPEALHEAEKVMNEESKNALQNYYIWHIINFAASYVDDETRAIEFDFWGKTMSGKQEDKPRWKRAVESVDDAMGDALGQLYVQKYFPAEAKERMLKLVANLQQALGERIDVQEWMSDSTKRVAHEKLDAFYVKVGYPDKWKDYSSLQVSDIYLQNILFCNEWAIQDMIANHLGKPVDKDEWHMTPQTVNAYYNPTTNEICFPAGILQPPFFDMEADDAFNYGAIGVVIGHEMTHGFDDQGSLFDKDGNLRQWWSETDRNLFTSRIDVMRKYHNAIEVLPGLHANGSFTLGENMADHGGLMVAFQAFQNATKDASLADKDGFTPAQRFFLAYANVWAQNIRDEEIRKRVNTDPHQLGKWRVNGQMPHIDAWYEAFGITESDPMFIPKEERVTIW